MTPIILKLKPEYYAPKYAVLVAFYSLDEEECKMGKYRAWDYVYHFNVG